MYWVEVSVGVIMYWVRCSPTPMHNSNTTVLFHSDLPTQGHGFILLKFVCLKAKFKLKVSSLVWPMANTRSLNSGIVYSLIIHIELPAGFIRESYHDALPTFCWDENCHCGGNKWLQVLTICIGYYRMHWQGFHDYTLSLCGNLQGSWKFVDSPATGKLDLLCQSNTRGVNLFEAPIWTARNCQCYDESEFQIIQHPITVAIVRKQKGSTSEYFNSWTLDRDGCIDFQGWQLRQRLPLTRLL